MSEYIKTFTKYGLEKQTQCLYNQEPFSISAIVIGDGNGEIPEISSEQTSLVNQRDMLAISESISNGNTHQFFAKIPNDIDDYVIREIGLVDEENKLIWVSQFDMETHSEIENLVSENIIGVQITLTDGITVVTVDDNIQTASKDYVRSNFQALVEKSQPNGYCPLGEDAKVPNEFLPSLATRNIGEIITSTIPLIDAGLHLLDGALIDGNGIYSAFVNYISDLYAETIGYYQSNVIKVGSLTDNNGILSGFSTTAYATLPNIFNPMSNPWELVLKVTTGNSVSGETNITSNNSNEPFLNPAIQLYNSHFRLLLSSDGTSWWNNGYLGTYTVLENTTYFIKLIFDGTKYVLSYSLDNQNFIDDISVSNSTPIFVAPAPLQFGTNTGLNFEFLGSIDFKESYININGQRWWTGAVEVKPAFCTEEQWQTSVTNYGVCGKFVYDGENNTVRLPKVTGFIEGASEISNLGDLTEAGLPDHNHIVPLTIGTFLWQGGGTPAYSIGYDPTTVTSQTAQSSNSIYGNSLTVQPQSVKVFYYIVIATSSKTDIEVDIDEIAADINGKADADLSNVPSTIGILTESYRSGASWYRVYSDGWCVQGGITSIIPANGNLSVTLLKGYVNTDYCVLANSTQLAQNYANAIYNKTQYSFTVGAYAYAQSYIWQAEGYIR